MKRQDLDKHQQASNDELVKTIAELEQEFVNTNQKKTLGSLKNLKKPISLRHDIARLKTILHNASLVNESKADSPKQSS